MRGRDQRPDGGQLLSSEVRLVAFCLAERVGDDEVYIVEAERGEPCESLAGLFRAATQVEVLVLVQPPRRRREIDRAVRHHRAGTAQVTVALECVAEDAQAGPGARADPAVIVAYGSAQRDVA